MLTSSLPSYPLTVKSFATMYMLLRKVVMLYLIFKQLVEIHGISSCVGYAISHFRYVLQSILFEYSHCRNPASENVPVQVCIVDSKDPNDFTEFHFNLNTYIEVMDIIEVDETDKSMTLYVYMMLEWFDETYSVNGFDQIDSFEIPLSQYDDIRRPSLLFLNSFDVKKMPLFGSDVFHYFWIYNDEPTRFEYSEYLQVKLGCNFEFKNFPFDRFAFLYG